MGSTSSCGILYVALSCELGLDQWRNPCIVLWVGPPLAARPTWSLAGTGDHTLIASPQASCIHPSCKTCSNSSGSVFRPVQIGAELFKRASEQFERASELSKWVSEQLRQASDQFNWASSLDSLEVMVCHKDVRSSSKNFKVLVGEVYTLKCQLRWS